MNRNFLGIWYAALHSPHGVRVPYEGAFAAVEVALNKARKEAQDPALFALSIHRSPFSDSELWVLHKTPLKERRNASEGRPADDEAHSPPVRE